MPGVPVTNPTSHRAMALYEMGPEEGYQGGRPLPSTTTKSMKRNGCLSNIAKQMPVSFGVRFCNAERSGVLSGNGWYPSWQPGLSQRMGPVVAQPRGTWGGGWPMYIKKSYSKIKHNFQIAMRSVEISVVSQITKCKKTLCSQKPRFPATAKTLKGESKKNVS